MSSTQFDWYKLSLINLEKPNLQQFQLIIRNPNIAKTIERIPTSYRKNLLVLFQTLSAKMKYQARSLTAANQSLKFRKNTLADKTQSMEKDLQQSKSQLIRMKAAVVEKKKLSKKLQDKIQTLKKNKTQETYFCPFCSRNDFSSRQIFSFHMYSEHQTYKTQQQNLKISGPQNNSFASSAQNQLKDFIMTLKDKEMQMMKMILSQKKQMQTQELQKLYEKQMMIMTGKNRSQPQYLKNQNYYKNQGDLGNQQEQINVGDDGELKGQSQFLFYQKSQKYKRAAQKQQYSLKKTIQQQRKRQLNRHPYYDIFKDLQQNKSLSIQQNKLHGYNKGQNLNKRQFDEQYNHYSDSNCQNYGNRSQNSDFKILKQFQLKNSDQLQQSLQKNITQKLRLNIQPLKMTSTNLQYQQFNPSITDRLKQQQNKNNVNNHNNLSNHNNSIYSNGFGRKTISKAIYNEKYNNQAIYDQNQYVFNSGPLQDDNKAGYSDYEDYFGPEAQRKQAETKERRNTRNNSKLMIYQREYQQIAQKQQKNQKQAQINMTNSPQVKIRSNDSMIEDEQIKLNPGSYSFVSKSSLSKQQISQLLSPNKQQFNFSNLQLSNQNKYNKYHSIHQKSSQIVDLSDSFSRRDFQLSKDQESINLSDLKLSKLLQKKRIQEKHQSNQTQNYNSPTYGKVAKSYQQEVTDFSDKLKKKSKQYILVSQEKQLNPTEMQDGPKIKLLNQFERKLQIPSPLAHSEYNFQKKQTYELSQFYKNSSPGTSNNKFLNNNSNSNSNSNQNQNTANIMNQFVHDAEMMKKQNTSPNMYSQQDKQQERAFSPQQFFANEMKKDSSYGMPNQKSKNSSVSNSISQSQNSSLPPKVDFKIYQKQPYFNNQNQNQYKNQQSKSSQESLRQSRNHQHSQESIKKSSSRQRKKFQIHEDLQDKGNQGILNEFMKKQFAGEKKPKTFQIMKNNEPSSEQSRNKFQQSRNRSEQSRSKQESANNQSYERQISVNKKSSFESGNSSVSRSNSQGKYNSSSQKYSRKSYEQTSEEESGALDQFIK